MTASIPTSKKCVCCSHILPKTEFYIVRGRLTSRCKKCELLKNKEWRSKNNDKVKSYAKNYYQNNKERFRIGGLKWATQNREKYLAMQNASMKKNIKLRRLEFIKAYGGKCECCGESQPEFLTLEHKDKSGQAHRKIVRSSHRILGHLKRDGWPKDRFGILCWNCNLATRFGRICPHQIK